MVEGTTRHAHSHLRGHEVYELPSENFHSLIFSVFDQIDSLLFHTTYNDITAFTTERSFTYLSERYDRLRRCETRLLFNVRTNVNTSAFNLLEVFVFNLILADLPTLC